VLRSRTLSRRTVGRAVKRGLRCASVNVNVNVNVKRGLRCASVNVNVNVKRGLRCASVKCGCEEASDCL